MGSLYIVVVSSFSTEVTSHDELTGKYHWFCYKYKSSAKLSAEKAYNNKIDFKNYK